MNILVVGGGGREHAIICKLRENKEVETVYALPGNGGMADVAECHPIAADDVESIVRFAKEKKVDYVVVAPDDPLVKGCVDALGIVFLLAVICTSSRRCSSSLPVIPKLVRLSSIR